MQIRLSTFSETDRILHDYAQRLIETAQKRKNISSLEQVKRYAVISTPRVGSSLLCQRLEKTGKAGWPVEWFNERYVHAYCSVLGIARPNLKFGEYVATLIMGTVSDTGVFGVNFHVNQYMGWLKAGIDLLNLKFDRIYWIERHDKISQAYSYAKAMKTDIWSKPSETADKELLQKITISPQEVALYLYNICHECAFFEQNLEAKTHRRFYYDELARDHSLSAVDAILGDFGLQQDKAKELPLMQKQSTGQDAEQIARIKAYLTGEAEA